MERFIKQLMEDIKEAKKRIPSKPYYEAGPELEGIEYVLELENNPYLKMSNLFGIEKNCFPPIEKLTNQQIDILVKEIESLWHAYSFYPVFPDNLPSKYKYKVMVDRWEEEVQYISEGNMHIEFCHYEPEECPFPQKYCMCKDFPAFSEDTDDFSYTDNIEVIAILDKELKEIYNDKRTPYKSENKIDKYVKQLIEDLAEAKIEANNKNYILQDAETETDKVNIELANAPFQTIEELTGILKQSFPPLTEMDGVQIRLLLKAMLQLMDAYNLEIMYPEKLPFEMKYDILSEFWDIESVQYLPSSGMDVDFCTGDPHTCPFGEYCYCGYNINDFNDDESPEKSDKDIELPF